MTSAGRIIVGMADLNCLKHPAALATLGLGSCIGIALYDPSSRVIGMAHCMLSDSTKFTVDKNRAKYVDTAIVDLIDAMAKLGAARHNLKAKVAGGAQMFAVCGCNNIMKIGDNNIEATVSMLGKLHIPIVSRETGGTFGRTIELSSEDFRLSIKAIGQAVRYI